MQIIQDTNYPFRLYQSLVDKYCGRDPRELCFQNKVLIPLFETIFANNEDIDLVDTSMQSSSRESETHTRKNYAGISTPDFIVVRNWNYANQDLPAENYLGVVEVKSPALNPVSKHSAHTEFEVNDYLSQGNRVILTDCYEWFFLSPEDRTAERIVLHDENGWITRPVETDAFVGETLGLCEQHEECENWDYLLRKIPAFLGIE